MGANARGHTYIAVSTALVVLSTVIVGIRVAARVIKSNLGWDDYAISCSGKPFSVESLNHSECFFANEISYTLLVPTIKVSILLLYRRIFSVPKFQLASLLAGGLVLAWCLAVFITVLVQCRPISFNWNKNQSGTCISAKSFFFGNAISNLLIDVIILALPIPMVLQLQLRLSQKLTILGIFLLGEYKLIEDSVCVASVMRVVTLDIFNDDTSCAFARISPAFEIRFYHGGRHLDFRRTLRRYYLRLFANYASVAASPVLFVLVEYEGF
ncbi:hypothetical protein N7534_004435 [Penicillium rubens]|nr:hypothetical protein N7534_004435 [Penicillium rubens]